ncbi:uncharacterized protein LOC132805091 [Ziziphus jujuba]|uniref:Uncharacterized protein LOC132805091 n=1 Tax=Ziziphus jujuba TaxID=326968 RepID=A0ABM4AGK2_ZIZJJ|nr:uncharacterized protein LOC132805091 [Ziziphus jujuba]
MDNQQRNLNALQHSLRTLTLKPKRDNEENKSERTLVGRMLTTRRFTRFKLIETTNKSWHLATKIKVVKVDENLFTFLLGSKEKNDCIFRNRPWSFNGAHLILKEWPANRSLKEISFDATTFSIQIHGLPPLYLHEEIAFQIGSMLGNIQQDSISKICVVGQRFLKFRIDLSSLNPLPPGFFQDREDGKERWIQFKYEKLSDFYYKCGKIDHVIGIYKFEQPATITSTNGVTAKLYGPWLWAKHDGSLWFINPLENDDL